MPFALGNSELSCVTAGLRVPVLGMPYPERDSPVPTLRRFAFSPVWAWSVATQVAQATYVPAIFDGTASGTPLEWRERSVYGQLHGQCHPPEADIMRI